MTAGTAILILDGLVAVGAYGWGVRRLRAWPVRRTAAFVAGVACACAALMLPDVPLAVHMAAHLALALVAAPLLVAGSPLALALRSAGRPARRVLRAPWLAHPMVGWGALATIMVGAHLPPVWEATDHGLAHVAAHAGWLAAGILFWRPLLGVDPVPRRPGLAGRMLLMLSAMAPMGGVGSTMLVATDGWYAGTSAAEVRAAGAVMWIGGGTALALMAVLIGYAAAVREHRRRLRFEERLG